MLPPPFAHSGALPPAVRCQQYNWLNDSRRSPTPSFDQLSQLIVVLFVIVTQLTGWHRMLRTAIIQSIVALDNWTARCVRSNGYFLL